MSPQRVGTPPYNRASAVAPAWSHGAANFYVSQRWGSAREDPSELRSVGFPHRAPIRWRRCSSIHHCLDRQRWGYNGQQGSARLHLHRKPSATCWVSSVTVGRFHLYAVSKTRSNISSGLKTMNGNARTEKLTLYDGETSPRHSSVWAGAEAML